MTPSYDRGTHMYGSNSDAQLPPHIFSRIRNFNNLALNSIGGLFSAPLSSLGYTDVDSADYGHDLWNSTCDSEPARTPNAGGKPNQFRSQDCYDVCDTEAPTPTQTRSNSPHRLNRSPDVKKIFTNFSCSRQTNSCDQIPPLEDDLVSQPSPPPPFATPPSIISASCSFGSDYFVTPPLTPDIIDDRGFLSPASVALDVHYDPCLPARHRTSTSFDHEDAHYTRFRSLEVKEGKRPERVVCYDALIGDSPGSYKAKSVASARPQSGTSIDDRDEWYGLEYTLELSSRGRRTSNTQSPSIGEHSKSRESWAMIHQGTIHPSFEDEDYYQWKNWHRYLDRQDERRKHKKGLDFKAKSKDLAWFYADEIKTRDVMYRQKEEYGAITQDVTERLAILAENRPDSYVPPKKHNLAWHLKRSQSVACLRELRPLPGLNPE